MCAYEEIYRQLSRGKMPPKEAVQPSADERRHVLAELKTLLDKVIDDRGTRYSGAFARRLNREELQNDLFDTLGIDRTFYNLQPFADLLPEEGRIDGFDTVGAGLGQSSLLLEQYQQTVDRYLALITNDYSPQRWRIKFGHRYTDKEQSFYEGLGERYFLHRHRVNEGKGETPPPPQLDGSVPAFDLTWQLAGSPEPPRRNEAEVEAAVRSFFSNAVDNDKDKRGHLELERTGGLPLINNDSLMIANRIGMVMRSAPLSVAATGRYKLRMRCRLRFTDGVEPAIVHARYFNRSHHFIGRFEQRDLADEPTYRFDEDAPRLCFENPNRSLAMKPGEWMVLEFDDFRSTAEVYNATNSGFTFDFRFESAAQPKTRQVPRELPAKNGVAAVVPTLEEIEAHYPFLVDVDYLEVEGPYPLVDRPSDLIPTGPADGSEARATAHDCLAKFLPRLYRGPIEQSDLDLLLGIFDRNFSRTQDFRGSLRTAICAAYLSPKHLFVSNAPAKRKPGTPLSAHELATRLSLFLWSSTPDAELRSAAERGELTDSAILERQAKRLLDHPYASELSANFASQWLHLYSIGLNDPDPDLYSYDKHLEQSMVNETLRFFHEIPANRWQHQAVSRQRLDFGQRPAGRRVQVQIHRQGRQKAVLVVA